MKHYLNMLSARAAGVVLLFGAYRLSPIFADNAPIGCGIALVLAYMLLWHGTWDPLK